MQTLIIFFSLTVLSIGGYLLWPSRYNIVTHLNIGFVFIAVFVPVVILQYQDYYPASLVSLFTKIVFTGSISYMAGMYLGFYSCHPNNSKLSFDVLDVTQYEQRVIGITKYLLFFCIVGLVLSYTIMGFVPMFAADPLAAKFFRGAYQKPYMRVAVLYRLCFYILSTIAPIAIVIGYHYKKKVILLATGIGIFLMLISLSRGPAFSGVLIALTVIMSFKSKFHFRFVILLIISSYLLSAFFYLVAGITQNNDVASQTFWASIAQSAPDFTDALYFLDEFRKNPKWTYGRTIYGSFIPGHYEWNPAVYTLQITTAGADVDEIVSGGIRIPMPFWGYVSFQWIGVIIFSMFTGVLNGVFLKYTKYWILKHSSLLTRAVVVIINVAIFSNISAFYGVAIYYSLPPIMIMLLYMFRFKIK